MKLGIIGAGNLGGTLTRRLEEQLDRKAFNDIYAQQLLEKGRPGAPPGRIALPVAGDQAAKSVVLGLVDELGFDPVDGGGLNESWRQQPGTPVYATDLDAAGVRKPLAQASPERKPLAQASPERKPEFGATRCQPRHLHGAGASASRTQIGAPPRPACVAEVAGAGRLGQNPRSAGRR